LKKVVKDVLQGEKYRAASHRMSDSIHKAGGVQRAADLIETALGG
jgi:UDP:flavonoid glycosyltransferase YjiC (YdhE family)